MNKHLVSILLVNFALAGITIIPEITSNSTNLKLYKLQSERQIKSELIAKKDETTPGDGREDSREESHEDTEKEDK